MARALMRLGKIANPSYMAASPSLSVSSQQRNCKYYYDVCYLNYWNKNSTMCTFVYSYKKTFI